MSRIKEIDQEINKLKDERLQIVRAKTVTMGQLMDVAEKFEQLGKFNKVYFANKLLLYISLLEKEENASDSR